MLGRQSETAIAAATRLAEVYDGGRTRLSAHEIARARGLPAPFVAKLLTILTRAGIVNSVPGPGGGYVLARDPGRISLSEIASLFERESSPLRNPNDAQPSSLPRALAERLRAARSVLDDILVRMTLADCRDAAAALETGHSRDAGPSG